MQDSKIQMTMDEAFWFADNAPYLEPEDQPYIDQALAMIEDNRINEYDLQMESSNVWGRS